MTELIEAIKEQQALINQLRAQLDDEKTSKEDLKAALDKRYGKNNKVKVAKYR